jgi:hypothetical protein
LGWLIFPAPVAFVRIALYCPLKFVIFSRKNHGKPLIFLNKTSIMNLNSSLSLKSAPPSGGVGFFVTKNGPENYPTFGYISRAVF